MWHVIIFTGGRLHAGARAAEDDKSQGSQQDGAGEAAAEQILPSHLQPRPTGAQTSQGGLNLFKYFQIISNFIDEEVVQEDREDRQCEDVHLEPVHQQHVLLRPEDDDRGGVQHVPDVPDVPLTQGPGPWDGATVLVKP